jgi:SpoVK/Ycf46/Vps4 family AAA+-type ATPase
MARSDLLIELIRAGTHGDQLLFRKAVEALIAEERAKHHHVLADRLADLSRRPALSRQIQRQPENELGSDLVLQVVPRRTLDSLILPEQVRQACLELIEEQHRVELLRSHGLEPRHRILLEGPPGNGKTSLAEAVAEALSIPMLIVRYEAVIGSFLGETAQRLGRLFEFVRTRNCVLFFDEFDAIAKERGDSHETGEIKRVVSSLLMQIDRLPTHVVVVTASNHPELLDRAAWRRFELQLTLPRPEAAQREQWFQSMEESFGASFGESTKTLGEIFSGASYSDLESFSLDVRRRFLLAVPDADLPSVVRSRLPIWKKRLAVRDSS